MTENTSSVVPAFSSGASSLRNTLRKIIRKDNVEEYSKIIEMDASWDILSLISHYVLFYRAIKIYQIIKNGNIISNHAIKNNDDNIEADFISSIKKDLDDLIANGDLSNPMFEENIIFATSYNILPSKIRDHPVVLLIKLELALIKNSEEILLILERTCKLIRDDTNIKFVNQMMSLLFSYDRVDLIKHFSLTPENVCELISVNSYLIAKDYVKNNLLTKQEILDALRINFDFRFWCHEDLCLPTHYIQMLKYLINLMTPLDIDKILISALLAPDNEILNIVLPKLTTKIVVCYQRFVINLDTADDLITVKNSLMSSTINILKKHDRYMTWDDYREKYGDDDYKIWLNNEMIHDCDDEPDYYVSDDDN